LRLLVTGATGFVGNVLLDMLPQGLDYSQLSLMLLPGDPGRARLEAKALPRTVFIEADVTDAARVDAAVQGHTHVIHLAGLISYWCRDRRRLQSVNRDGVRNVVNACLRHGVLRLVHVSSVGAIGRRRDQSPADEDTPYNWPRSFHYMRTKRAGQQLVEQAVRERGLPALILNPASLMGPGDPDPRSPHNQLYARIYFKTLLGCFAGGLAVTDVRDLASIILKALSGGKVGEKYLIVGANVPYTHVVRSIAECFDRRVYPFRVPAPLLSAAGACLELAGLLSGRRPALTRAYGRLSGWHGYYANDKGAEAFAHRYIPFAQTIADACAYFREHYGSSPVRAA